MRSATRSRAIAAALLAVGCLMASVTTGVAADEPLPSARRTPTVQLIEDCLPAVVSVFVESQGENGETHTDVGSGSIIHAAGFVLTNDHVVRRFRGGGKSGVVLSTGEALPMRVVARLVPEDLAILQVKAKRPLPTIVLGRSHDVVLGEPTLVIGSPGGLVHSVSTGIVSGVNRSTRSESNFLPYMIQTSAAVSRGNSGGPLINALGEQIGVMSTIGDQLQNVAFAITVDHVREALPRVLEIEQRQGVWCGIECDPLVDGAIVQRIEPGSPADTAGLQVGDRIRRFGELELRYGVDQLLAMVGRQRGDLVPVEYDRAGESRETRMTLATLPLPIPVPEADIVNGMEYSVYRGQWDQLPDFSELTPERTGHCQAIDLDEISAPPEGTAVRFAGFIKIPQDSFYAFYSVSDDGSRLWIGERLVVDNDGTHPAREAGGFVRLRGGLHPFRLDYFQKTGKAQLSVGWEGTDLSKQPIPAAAFYRPAKPEAASPPSAD